MHGSEHCSYKIYSWLGTGSATLMWRVLMWLCVGDAAGYLGAWKERITSSVWRTPDVKTIERNEMCQMESTWYKKGCSVDRWVMWMLGRPYAPGTAAETNKSQEYIKNQQLVPTHKKNYYHRPTRKNSWGVKQDGTGTEKINLLAYLLTYCREQSHSW